ncbi:cupin domain-containing protein [uncultured Paludibaculum sp.]|uniref:cupin domain-containing protein n=1 Tax=uncultured Paludibaculum sp. TaxID=1765020 RepID=UPI002AAB592E|nr:cupin domain-containing protein [uncultured Paludibaculum sp.]
MGISRRDWTLLIPALTAATAAAQEQAATGLPSKVYHADTISYGGDDKKKGRRFLRGAEHSGFTFEVHETVLGPGMETHAPHKHEHEEFVILVEGMVEAFLDGKTERVEPGSVVYFGSNRMHNLRNAGAGPCRYYVIELRGKAA